MVMISRSDRCFTLMYLLLCAVLLCFATKGSHQAKAEQKIAFLFLTREHLPFERIWREFFRFRVRPEEYSIYVHPTKKGFKFRNTSMFYGREIEHIVQTTYLTVTVQKAERELIKAALVDKDNAFFCLISESCIPLHPFQAWKSALFSSGKSPVNACPMSPGISELKLRWRPELASVPGMNESLWRKSPQQFALIRKHAELVAYDEVLLNAFINVPIPDEHYIPTLLAWKGLDNETSCAGGFAYVHYCNTCVHPRTFGPRDISPTLFKELDEQDLAGTGFSEECSGLDLCHFTARKFAPEARGMLMEHIEYILTDTYKQASHYPQAVHSLLTDLLPNGSVRNPTPDKEKTRLMFIPKEHSVVKSRAERSIYIIQNSQRREIPNMRTFISLGFDLDNVTILTEHKLRLIPLGPPYPDVLA